MLEIIGAALKILQLLLGKWFEFNDEQKKKAKEILTEVPNAKTAHDITYIFDSINRM
jgi:hypothetical protein